MQKDLDCVRQCLHTAENGLGESVQREMLVELLQRSSVHMVLDPFSASGPCPFASTVALLCEASRVCEGYRRTHPNAADLDAVLEIHEAIDEISVHLLQCDMQA